MVNKRFTVFGSYGWGNTGDDAIGYALLSELCILFPDKEMIVLTQRPIINKNGWSPQIIFIKRNLLSVLKALIGSSVLIVGEGTRIHDHDKCIKHKFSLFVFLVILAIAKVSGNQIYLVGYGIGPISKSWGKVILKLLRNLTDHISVRDTASYQILREYGFAEKVSLAFDLAPLLLPYDIQIDDMRTNKKQTLGICLCAAFRWFHSDKEKDHILIGEFARELNNLLDSMPELEIRLFVFCNKATNSDVDVTQMLEAQLRASKRVIIMPYDPDPTIVLSEVAKCDAFVGMRYHSCVFAYLAKIPLLIVNYHPKNKSLAEEIGLGEGNTISLDDILQGKLGQYLQNLLKNGCHAKLPVEQAKQMSYKAFDHLKLSGGVIGDKSS